MKNSSLNFLSLFFVFFVTQSAFAQRYQARVLDSKTHQAIEYVNIGIVNKANGTTSNTEGKYEITLDETYNNDSLKFSCIGYAPYSIKVSDYKKRTSKDIELKVKDIQLNVVNVKPRTFVPKTLGYTMRSNKINAGFKENKLGSECGVLLKIKKTAVLKQLNVNISHCSYDTVFFRINVYQQLSKRSFTNVLVKPIYLKVPGKQVRETISFDLKPYNIIVAGDCLVTLEQVSDLGKGELYFSAGFGRTYNRKTSQASWNVAPVGIGMNVIAEVEK